MNDNSDFEKLETQARYQLRQAENQLDDDMRQRLAAARHKALISARHWWPPYWLKARFTVPVTGFALASIVTLVVVFSPMTHNNGQGQKLPDSRLSDNIEFYEDLDFYYWLSETDPDLRG